MRKKSLIILFLVIAVGLFLRIYRLNQLPLYGDELTMVYDSYSILRTGKDQTGQIFPITFKMGAGRPGGYVYASVPFVALFGPTAMGVRSLSVLSGLGIIILMYFLGRSIFSEDIGLAAALLASVSPWDLSLSRGGYEAHFALFLVLLGVYCFLKSKVNIEYLIAWAFLWGLAIHTYPIYKLILPIFLVPLALKVKLKKVDLLRNKLVLTISVFVLVGFSFLSLKETFFGISEKRLLTINVFSDREINKEIVEKINYERSLIDNKGVQKIFHNKAVEYSNIIFSTFINNFSPDYLFISGDGNPRHNMSVSGVLYVFEAITLLTGFSALVSKKKYQDLIFIISWLVVAALGNTFFLTNHALRSSFMLPPLLILSSIGPLYYWKMFRRGFYLPLVILLILFLVQFVINLERIFILSPKEFSSFWADSAKEAVDYAMENKDKYDYIFLSDKIENVEYAYEVYNKVDPSEVIKQNNNIPNFGEYQFKKFDNIYISNVPDTRVDNFIDGLSGKILYIGNYLEGPNVKNEHIVNGTDNKPSLLIITKDL